MAIEAWNFTFQYSPSSPTLTIDNGRNMTASIIVLNMVSTQDQTYEIFPILGLGTTTVSKAEEAIVCTSDVIPGFLFRAKWNGSMWLISGWNYNPSESKMTWETTMIGGSAPTSTPEYFAYYGSIQEGGDVSITVNHDGTTTPTVS